MFKKKTSEPGPAPELVERWKAIAAKAAPADYIDVGGKHLRASRNRVFRQATATLEGGEVLPVVIKNLSSSGCRIEFFRRTPLTPLLVIDETSIPLTFRAEVIWQGEGAAGLKIAGREEAD